MKVRRRKPAGGTAMASTSRYETSARGTSGPTAPGRGRPRSRRPTSRGRGALWRTGREVPARRGVPSTVRQSPACPEPSDRRSPGSPGSRRRARRPSPSLRRVSRGTVTRSHRSRTVRLLLAKASAQHRLYRSRSRTRDLRPRDVDDDQGAWDLHQPGPPITTHGRLGAHRRQAGGARGHTRARARCERRGKLIAETVHALEIAPTPRTSA